MNKKILLTTILFVSVSMFAIALLSQEKNGSEQNKQGQIILFYGNGCPSCIVVEEYVEQNNLEEKISLEQKEVYYNQDNAHNLVEKAKICGLSTNSIGIPFLWDGSECFVGGQEIIEFLEQQNNEK